MNSVAGGDVASRDLSGYDEILAMLEQVHVQTVRLTDNHKRLLARGANAQQHANALNQVSGRCVDDVGRVRVRV
jgi:hypothetical protein